MKRALCLLMIVGLIVPCLADSVRTSAGAAVLMDADTGQVLYEHRADERRLKKNFRRPNRYEVLA